MCARVRVCVCACDRWVGGAAVYGRSRLSLRRLEIHRAAAVCRSAVRVREEQVEEEEEDDGGLRQHPLHRGGRTPVELEMEQNRQGSGPNQAEDPRSARIIKARTEPAQKERE